MVTAMVSYEVHYRVDNEDRTEVRHNWYHVLFTTSLDGNLTENRHVKGKVRGDIFVLRLSKTMDEEGRGYYVDIKPHHLDWTAKSWEVLERAVENFMEVRGQFVTR